jgi:hypothetical protein
MIGSRRDLSHTWLIQRLADFSTFAKTIIYFLYYLYLKLEIARCLYLIFPCLLQYVGPVPLESTHQMVRHEKGNENMHHPSLLRAMMIFTTMICTIDESIKFDSR